MLQGGRSLDVNAMGEQIGCLLVLSHQKPEQSSYGRMQYGGRSEVYGSVRPKGQAGSNDLLE